VNEPLVTVDRARRSGVALNVAVLAVTVLLAGAQAGIGLGLGLFGILSIIRLRSDQITQEEVVYFAAASGW
jgi:hypothetical protein